MEKSEITLHNTILDNVWRYLYDQVKLMGFKTIEYSKLVEYQGGTSRNVTYRQTVQYIQPPQHNRLVVNYTLVIEPEGKPTQIIPELMTAIEFYGWQLQINTVLIRAEFLPTYKQFVDEFWNDLSNKFKATVQYETLLQDAVQDSLLSNPESNPKKQREILFEETLPTTPRILFDVLHDFWLDCAPSLEKTAISGMKFNLELFDEFFSRIYIQLGSYIFGRIAQIEIRRLNESLLKVTIPSTKGDVSWYRGEEWDKISSETDKFLLGFAAHLQELFSGHREIIIENGRDEYKQFTTDILPEQVEKVQDERKRGEPGRRHLPDDVWAWEQVNIHKKPMNEIYTAWEKREGVVNRNLIDPRRQFNRITKPEWGKRTK